MPTCTPPTLNIKVRIRVRFKIRVRVRVRVRKRTVFRVILRYPLSICTADSAH